MIERIRIALVIAPHPDDEVLGVGGTMARLSGAGREVHVAIVTRGRPPLFTEEESERDREEARAAHALLGVAHTHLMDFPAAELDTVPHAEVNRALAVLMREIAPDTLFIPFNGDIHLDHQLVFISSMVAARPNRPGGFPKRIYAYETLSETNWHAPYVTPAFVPNCFVDIADYLDLKLAAMEAYLSQIKPAPNERSLQAIQALSRLRGATVHVSAAEAFVLLREVG